MTRDLEEVGRTAMRDALRGPTHRETHAVLLLAAIRAAAASGTPSDLRAYVVELTENLGLPTPHPRNAVGFIGIEESGCWPWRGARVRGYGRVTVARRGLPAHRVVYEMLVGPIPDGHVLDHLCRNRACVNPAHLEPVTQRENILRGVGPAAQNAQKTHCKHGHPFDAKNTGYRATGKRACKTCARRFTAESRARKSLDLTDSTDLPTPPRHLRAA